MTHSILRFKAPMMSFGAPIVSEEGLIQPFPALSMMTGLLANALGYDHSEAKKHERLQQALSYAVREDEPGEKIVDYQTVWLGKESDPRRPGHDGHLYAKSKKDSHAWTTRKTKGEYLDQRAGSDSSKGTAERNREYWADAQYTVALHADGLSAEEIEDALRRPERPLFIGRKPCLPGKRLFQGTVEASSPRAALRDPSTIPTNEQGEKIDPTRIWYESDDGKPVTDARDWTNQVHVGERRVRKAPY
jgi:CRISPR system Cascade subunit CasD